MEDINWVLKRGVELSKPDLRHYYRMPRKGRITATYASDGSYWADVQLLRNDESADPNEPVIPKVEIPVLWGGANRGMVCPPEVGTYVVVSYCDGDPNYPFISHVRWYGNHAPQVSLHEWVLQLEPGVFIKIDSEKRIIQTTTADWIVQAQNVKVEAAGMAEIKASNAKIQTTGPSEIMAAGSVNLNSNGDISISSASRITGSAPRIDLG
jgi:hypothetical protein